MTSPFEQIDKNNNDNSNNKKCQIEFPNCVKGYVVIGNGFRQHLTVTLNARICAQDAFLIL